jgi:rare lipoprotein A
LRPSRFFQPHSIHPTTYVAAATVAALCVAGALYVGEKAAHYLSDKIVIASWKPPALPRDLVAPEPRQSSNLAKKTAREPFRRLEARLVPEPALPQEVLPQAGSPRPGAPAPGDRIEENGAAGETGRASWYDLETPTASGEPLIDSALTAAHRSAPFGTKLRVVNLANGREVVVRVNDRGPFAKNRIIDLSKAAAQELGMIKTGVAKVSVTPVSDAFASAGDGAGG